MLRQIILAVLLALVPVAPLTAAPVLVRGGEHDGFTRLALDLTAPRDWTLDISGDAPVLRLQGLRDGFNLDTAFRKISAGRVSALTPSADGAGLEIALNCDCDLDAFMLGQRMLVIDIRGAAGPSPAARPQTRPRAGAQTPVSTPAETASSQPGEPQMNPDQPTPISVQYQFPFSGQSATPTLPLAFSLTPRAATPPPAETANAGQASMPTPDPVTPAIDPATGAAVLRAQNVSAAERAILRQLGRAASQGLLSPKAAHLPDHTQTRNNNGDQRAANPRPLPDAAHPGTPKRPGLNVRAQSSADRDFLATLPELGANMGARLCLSDKKLAITRWVDDAPFGQQVGALRAQLVGEFDRPDPGAGRALAKLYLHYGFGAEALHVMDVSKEEMPAYLHSMARILEHGHDTAAPGASAFHDQLDCVGETAFWAVLAHEHLPTGARPDEASVLRALSALPPHLRSYLGPMAADRFTEIGQPDTARQILRIVERGVDAPDARIRMSDGKLATATGDMSAASAAFDDVAHANSDLSPEAVIHLVDSTLTSGKPVDGHIASLAGAYAHEYRDDALGADLKRVHILALASSSDFTSAFQELASFSLSSDPTTTNMLQSHSFSALARSASDATFLKHTLPTDTATLETLADASANLVAERLLDLGFPDRADQILRPGATGGDVRPRRVLRARAALALGKPRRAEAEVLGLDGVQAGLLRAQARAMHGDHGVATELFAQFDQPEAAANQAWLSSDWAALAETGDQAIRPIARILADQAPPPAPGDTTPIPNPSGSNLPGSNPAITAPINPDPVIGAGPLAKNRTLLEESSQSRAALDTLLDSLRVDADQPQDR